MLVTQPPGMSMSANYVGESCDLKSEANTAVSRDWVWTAELITTNVPLSCENDASDGLAYQAAGSTFTITCGKDYAVVDLLSLDTPSFEDCIQTGSTRCDMIAHSTIIARC